jgi:hypothetical protein
VGVAYALPCLRPSKLIEAQPLPVFVRIYKEREIEEEEQTPTETRSAIREDEEQQEQQAQKGHTEKDLPVRDSIANGGHKEFETLRRLETTKKCKDDALTTGEPISKKHT